MSECLSNFRVSSYVERRGSKGKHNSHVSIKYNTHKQGRVTRERCCLVREKATGAAHDTPNKIVPMGNGPRAVNACAHRRSCLARPRTHTHVLLFSSSLPQNTRCTSTSCCQRLQDFWFLPLRAARPLSPLPPLTLPTLPVAPPFPPRTTQKHSDEQRDQTSSMWPPV